MDHRIPELRLDGAALSRHRRAAGRGPRETGFAADQRDVLRRLPHPPADRGNHGMTASPDAKVAAERRTLWIVLLLNAAIAVGFFVTGLTGDSSALLANGVDNLSETEVYALSHIVIGRAWWRGSGCNYVSISVFVVSEKKKIESIQLKN